MSTTGTTIDLEQQMLGEVDDDVGVQHESHPIRYHIWWGELSRVERVRRCGTARRSGTERMRFCTDPRRLCSRGAAAPPGIGAGPRGGEQDHGEGR